MESAKSANPSNVQLRGSWSIRPGVVSQLNSFNLRDFLDLHFVSNPRNYQPIDTSQQTSYAGSFYDPPANAYAGGIFTPTADNFESGGVGSEFEDEPPLLEGDYNLAG